MGGCDVLGVGDGEGGSKDAKETSFNRLPLPTLWRGREGEEEQERQDAEKHVQPPNMIHALQDSDL